jgi:hypothetical protein
VATQLEIVNLALVELGDNLLTSLTEDTKAARVMNLLWQPTVEDVLRDHTWRFARKRANLALLAEIPAFEWEHYFQLPADLIRMVCMGYPEDEMVWEIEGDRLLTNESTAQILYISRVVDTARFDAKFVTAAVLQLAIRAYKPLACASATEKAEMLKAYDKILMDAETIDSQEAPPPELIASRWVDARL